MVERGISQLAHVELLTRQLEDSARFFDDVLRLDESGRDDRSIHLRCWGTLSRRSRRRSD